MKSISEPFIRRPVMTVLVTLTAILFGLYAYKSMPVGALPNVEYPVIQVSASYPGMDPAMMSSSIATPLEKEFMTIQGLQVVTSTSSQGNTTITIVFNLDKNIDAAATDVQSAISRASGSLPPDMPAPPTYQKTDPNSTPILYMSITSSSMTTGQLYDYTKTEIAQRISILPGVSQVNVYGSPRGIRINVDPRQLYNRGLTMTDVSNAVRASSVSISSGNIKGAERSFTIIPGMQIDKAEDYNNIIISYKNGAPIYMRDVATCEDSLASLDTQMNFWSRDSLQTNGATGLVLAVQKASGANTVEVSKSIQELLPEFRKELPGSIQLEIIHDDAKSILGSLADVEETLIIAFALVVIVIFLFLGRCRDTLIPAVALPLSLLLTFIVMNWLGYSLDNLSLMALTLAIGFLVDDAIVFLENTVRLMEEGESPFAATIQSAKEISFTILSMTLSLAAVFIPLVFMEGQIGRVFKEFSITIIISIVASGIVSLTLTPLMCARMLGARSAESKTTLEKFANGLEAFFLKFYGKSLYFALRHKWVSVLSWIICLAGTLCFFKILPKTFLPAGDSGFIMGLMVAPQGTSPDQMKIYQARVDTALHSHPAIEKTITVTGIGQFLPAHTGFIFCFLKDREHRDHIQKVNEELTQRLFAIPGAIALVHPRPTLEIQTGAVDTKQGKYAFSLSCVDTKALYPYAQQIEQQLRANENFVGVNSNLYLGDPQLHLNVFRDRASSLKVTTADIAETLRNAYSENYSYLIKGTTDQYKVIVVADPNYRKNPDNLNQLYVSSQSGDLVPFRSVVSWDSGIGPVTVNHRNNFPCVNIYFDLKPGFAIGAATAALNKLTENPPPGILKNLEGEAQAFAQTMKSLTMLVFVAVFVMYIIMGILYESYVHPITVLSTLPVATVGGLATLYLFDAEFSLYAFVGIFMLMGIVKKNGIMLVDFAVERQKEGLSAEEAIHKACMERFRPIIMTTMAALIGAVPIALGWGADGESRMPLGLTVVGGLMFSQVLTLYVTPVIYVYFELFQERILDKIPFFARELKE